MGPFDGVDPAQFMTDFNHQLHDAITRSEDDLATIVDRFHTPDVVQVSDGHPMDRAKLIAHVRPVRRQKPEVRLQIDDVLVNGDCLAARYRMEVQRRRDGETEFLVVTVHAFNRYADDGRLQRADLLTRMERERTTAVVS